MQREKSFPVLNEELRRWCVDRENPSCAFSKFIGNENAVRKLQVSAYDALGRENHVNRELAFAFFGPSSSGKTTLARMYGNVVDLPFVEVGPKSLKCLQDLFDEMNKVLTASGIGLEEISGGYIVPPCIVFIDEAHALSDNVQQGLLKATEYGDAVMNIGEGMVVDMWNVTWMLGTTDEGKLFEAFRNRFSPVYLKYLNKKDVAKIIKINNPDFDDKVCDLVSHYNSLVVRKGLEFARYMRLVKNMTGKSWEECAKQVAADEGIDEFGMEEVHLRILKALSNGPIGQKWMPNVVGKKEEAVENFVMPWLLTETEDRKALVAITRRGYAITDAGVLELKKRLYQEGT